MESTDETRGFHAGHVFSSHTARIVWHTDASERKRLEQTDAPCLSKAVAQPTPKSIHILCLVLVQLFLVATIEPKWSSRTLAELRITFKFGAALCML